MDPTNGELYPALRRTVFLITGIVLLLAFLDAIRVAILLFAAAFIFALVLNPPVTWLEERGVHRALGAILVLLVVALFVGVFAWMVLPRLYNEGLNVVENLPGYVYTLSARLSGWLNIVPGGSSQADIEKFLEGRVLPPTNAVITRATEAVFSLFDLAVFAIIFLSTVGYALANPRPLFRQYLLLFPARSRDKATHAFVVSSRMLTAWIWSHVIVGTMEAVAALVALTLLGIPGALIWAAFTFFAELFPRVGPYVMAIPPILIALTISPLKALWVLIFYTVLNEFMGHVVVPFVRSVEMKLHPVLLLFAVVAFAYAFGIWGAIIATPLAAVFYAYYREFFVSTQPADTTLDEHVEQMVKRA